MNERIEVLIADGTTGYIHADTVDYENASDMIGDKLNIHYRDENGNFCEKIGEVVEIL